MKTVLQVIYSSNKVQIIQTNSWKGVHEILDMNTILEITGTSTSCCDNNIDGAETEKPELICFQSVFVSNEDIKKFLEIIKDCWKSKLNVQQLFRVIHERIRLKSPQRSQSIAITIFATFAFFAVRFLYYPTNHRKPTLKVHRKITYLI